MQEAAKETASLKVLQQRVKTLEADNGRSTVELLLLSTHGRAARLATEKAALGAAVSEDGTRPLSTLVGADAPAMTGSQ